MKKVLIVLALVLVALFILSITIFKDFEINPFHKKSLINTSIERTDSLKISNYESIGYTYKALFPYDFLIGEPNWGLLLGKSGKFLTKEDLLNRDFYIKCRDIGIDLNKHKAFFIIETRAIAGFKLDDYMVNPIDTYNEDSRAITLNAPKAEILTLEVVDNLKESNYPDVNITPKEWQGVVELVLPEIEKSIIDSGILKKSDSRNRDFLTSLYKGIGWNSVDFK